MPLTLNPRKSSDRLTQDVDQIRLVTWNSTSSNVQKLEQLASLVWGPPQLNDLVTIQEFTKRPNNDIRQLLKALSTYGWAFEHTKDEGNPRAATSRRSYLVIWNPLVLRRERGPDFIPGYSKAPQAPPLPEAGKRTRRPPAWLDPIMDVNNPPLATRFRHVFGNTTLFAYTWHVSPFQAGERVGPWPTDRLGPPDPTGQISDAVSFSRVVSDMQHARDREGVWILAGDLNVRQNRLTSAVPPLRSPFDPRLGFSLVSGGGSGLDHIVALYGHSPIKMTAFTPGMKLGDHAPLGAVI